MEARTKHIGSGHTVIFSAKAECGGFIPVVTLKHLGAKCRVIEMKHMLFEYEDAAVDFGKLSMKAKRSAA